MGQGIAIVIVIIIIAAAGIGGYYVATQIGGKEEETLTSKIPSGVDMVTHADVKSIIDDEDFRDLTNKGLQVYSQLNPYQEVPSSYRDLLNKFENKAGFKLSKFGGVTFFAKYPEGPTRQEYIGVIFSIDLTESELVSVIERAEEEELRKDTYNDVTVYKENRRVGWSPEEGVQYEWRIILGILPDGNYVTGNENAIKDVIDTTKGGKSAFSGPLKEGYEKAGSGYLKFAAKIPAERIPVEEFPPYINVQVFQDIESASGSFSKSDSTLKFSFRVKASSPSSAKDIKDAIDGMISLGKSMIDIEAIKDELGKISVDQTNSAVRIGYETTVEDIKNLIEQLPSFVQQPPRPLPA